MAVAASASMLVAAGQPAPTPAAGADPLTRPALAEARTQAVVMLGAARAGTRLVSVGERGLVLLSDDDGKAWRQAAATPSSVTLTAVRFVSPSHGWATGHAGLIMATTDGGEHWHRQLDGLAVARAMLGQAQAAQAASTDPSQAAKALAEARRLVAEGADKPFFDLWFVDDLHGYAVGAYGLFVRTDDAGATWSAASGLLPNPKASHLHAIRGQGDDLFIAGEQGLLLRSSDRGRSFRALTLPYSGSLFTLEVLPTGTLIVAGLRGNAFRSTDRGDSWQAIEGLPPVTWLASAVAADGSVWLGNQAGQLFASRDAGLHWTPVPPPPGPPPAPLTGLLALADGRMLTTTLRGLGAAVLAPVAMK